MKHSSIEKRLESLLGDNVRISEQSHSLAAVLPMSLRNRFQYYQVEQDGLSFMLAVEKSVSTLGKLTAYTKLKSRLENILGKDIVFYMPPLPANIRFRYMKAGLPYISEDGSANLPGILRMSLKKVAMPQKKSNKLTPLAQLIILRQLLKEDLEGRTQLEASNILAVSRMGISKALQELKQHQLCGYSGSIRFSLLGEALWEQAYPLMKTPVHAQHFIQAPTNKQAMLISGESALAQQSLLMETGLLTVAIGRKEYAELLKKGLFNFAADEEDANFILQVWNYPPALLVHPESRYVDPLSLILSLAGSSDERVLQELNQLQLPWK